VILAKTTVVQTASSGGAASNAFTRCTLNGDPGTNSASDDYAETELGRGDAAETGRATLEAHVIVIVSLAAPTSIALRCRRINNSGSPRTAVARETKLIAIRVDSITRTAVSG
jgi:hypothetical protein